MADSEALTSGVNNLGIAKPQNWDQKANKSITIAPPMCQRFGKKKSIYGNFTPNCNSLNRDPSHVQEFIANELSTTANLKSGGQLVLQGIYDGKHLQQALKKYVKNFVRCNVCESTNTSLSKGNRMTFLVCTDCKSQRTVETIKPGN
ncbi:MAG: translation initiation factor eIF-2 beta subunit [Paramarteilia canceri]